ncbi:EamA family transporter [Vibrio coralliilyticus]|uniref:EamA family transporter n=1 Tax=Vibrio coralliilyticus TaxID=190893 RepID=UPI000BAC15A9|nr:EamA family transporter [Vibrio coralliilyticus]NOI74657.1 EamA family transporter [Vibrio coralliilyticus]PAW05247.1 EamA family transporter [Vibrio coralliilyticus]
MTRTQRIATLAITALAPMVWGSTYIVTTELLPANSPLLASMLRALPAGIVLVLFSRSIPNGSWWTKLAVLGLLNIGFFFYCLFYAATYLPGGMAALIMSIQPILVMGLSVLLLRNTLTFTQIIASGLGIGGIAMLVVNNPGQLNTSGVVMGLLGTVSMALGVVLTKKWGRPSNMSLLSFTGWQLLFGGLMLLPVAISTEGLPQQITLTNVVGYSYLAIVGAMLAYSLWFRGIEKLSTVSVSFLGFLSSVSAVVLGYLILGQTLTWVQLIGALSVLVSILLAASAPNYSATKTNTSFTNSNKELA